MIGGSEIVQSDSVRVCLVGWFAVEENNRMICIGDKLAFAALG